MRPGGREEAVEFFDVSAGEGARDPVHVVRSIFEFDQVQPGRGPEFDRGAVEAATRVVAALRLFPERLGLGEAAMR